MTFADYPGRIEKNDERCVLAIETDTGQVLGVDFADDDPNDDVCQIVSAVLATAISSQIW